MAPKRKQKPRRPKRGRPVDADAEATRVRIREAATLLFSARGLDGVSVREIAAAAEVSVAMIQHSFGGKDGLYQACLDAMYARLDQLQHDTIGVLGSSGLVSPASILEMGIRAAYRLACDNQVMVRLILRTVIDTGGIDPGRREMWLRPFLDRASNVLSAITGRPPLDLRFTLQSLTFVVARYAITNDDELAAFAGVDHRDRKLLRQAAEEHVVDMMFRSLGATRDT
jgi:AcrR family transcriptional regulator